MTLIDRLMAAIDAREATARATLTDLFVGGNLDLPAGTTTGRWEVRKREFDDEVFVEEVGAGTVALASDVDLTMEDWTGLDPANAQHIADNDPATVLRMCDAHRRIVKRHAPRWVEGRNLDGDEREGYFCEHCDDPWPCPDLRDAAACYDLTEEDT